MTFVLGSATLGLLSYSYFGDWPIIVDVTGEGPEAIIGSPSGPGQVLVGTFGVGETVHVARLRVGRE